MASENADFAERREDLLQSIEQDEVELREAVHELAEAAEQKLDISEYIRSSPMPWLIGAFGVGFWLGMGSGESSDKQPQLIDYRRYR